MLPPQTTGVIWILGENLWDKTNGLNDDTSPKLDCRTHFWRKLNFFEWFLESGPYPPCWPGFSAFQRGITRLYSPKDTRDRAVFVKNDQIAFVMQLSWKLTKNWYFSLKNTF